MIFEIKVTDQELRAIMFCYGKNIDDLTYGQVKSYAKMFIECRMRDGIEEIKQEMEDL